MRISNAEPIDSIVDGASAILNNASNHAPEDTFYSFPTPSVETDNALTEYTLVKEVRVEPNRQLQNSTLHQLQPQNASNSASPKPQLSQFQPQIHQPKPQQPQLTANGAEIELQTSQFQPQIPQSRPKMSQFSSNNLEMDMEIYSVASTLSLGETVILSDGWLNRSTPLPSVAPSIASNTTTTTTTSGNDGSQAADSDFVLTLDVDTSASVI